MSDLFGNHIVGFSTRWLIYHVIGITFPFDRTVPVSSNSAGQTVQSTDESGFPSQSNMSLLISSPLGCQWIQIGGVWRTILYVICIQE